MESTPLQTAFPTLWRQGVPVPPAPASGGWWHPDSAAPIGGGEVPRVDPTWAGQAQNLMRNGAMAETSYQYPAGGIRPGNNEPAFLAGYVSTEGGTRLSMPHMAAAPFDAAPYDRDPLGLR